MHPNRYLRCRAFQTFGLFSSGIGVHYLPSTLVATQHQSVASKLIVGERLIPHDFIRAADARPFNIHDLLPSDTRFKVLVFAGNSAEEAQAKRVRALADAMARPEGFLAAFGRGDHTKAFDVWAISSAKKENVNYTGAAVSSFLLCFCLVLIAGSACRPPSSVQTALVACAARRHGYVYANRGRRVRYLRHR